MNLPKRSHKEAENDRNRSLVVMKYIGTILIAVAMIGLLGKPKPEIDKNPLVHLPQATQHVYAQEPKTDSKAVEQPKVEKTVTAPAQPQTPPKQAETKPEPPQPSGTCRDAIAREWPANLQQGAITVMTHENRSENPLAVGAVNNDGHGSRDYGCFQINDYWHAGFFANNDWRDPYANARYAYQIYKGRGNWTAWYAVAGILY